MAEQQPRTRFILGTTSAVPIRRATLGATFPPTLTASRDGKQP